MAKFCRYCGRPLAEGEVCICTAAPVTTPDAPMPQEAPVIPQTPTVPETPVQKEAVPIVPEVQPPVQPSMQAPVQQPLQQPVLQPQQPVAPVTANTFCRYCGRPLAEGEVCTCTAPQGVAPQGAAPTGYSAPGQGVPAYGAPVYSAPAAPSPVGQYLSKMWKVILEVFKHPFTAGSKFVSEGDFQTALGFIALQSLAVALFFMSFPLKFNHLANKISNNSDTNPFPTVKTFFVSFFGAFATACIFALLLFAFIKLAKKDTDYKHMLCVSGLHSLTSTPLILLGFLVSLMLQYNPNNADMSNIMGFIFAPLLWPLLIALAGIFLARFVSISIVTAGTNANRDQLIYVLFFTEVVMLVVAYFMFFKICGPMCLPDMSEVMGGSNGIGNIFNF